MTPEERQLIADLFDRLAQLENQPRDRDAERTISEGLARAPHAIYPLVQTVLVQDEALKAADAHIRELEAALGSEPEQGQRESGGFLDNMRDAIFGSREEPRGYEPRGGSAPRVPSSGRPMGVPPSFGTGAQTDAWGRPVQTDASGRTAPAGQPETAQRSAGGSFLGTAAAAAAGMIGGSLLLGGIKSAMGEHKEGPASGALDQLASKESGAAPAEGSDLSREAGADDIGRSAWNRDEQGEAAEHNNLADDEYDVADVDDIDFDDGDLA